MIPEHFNCRCQILSEFRRKPHIISNNENLMLCEKCGGRCCKSCSGIYRLSDFGGCTENKIKNIEEMLFRKQLVIDWWEASEPMYFLRPPHHESTYPRDPTYGGTCIHLGPSGCSKKFEERPYICRSLVPNRLGYGACNFSQGTLSKYDLAMEYFKNKKVHLFLSEFRDLRSKPWNSQKDRKR
jgi:hypothetical protein